MIITSKGDYALAPQGNHLARCFRVIDLGTQKSVHKGHERLARKILLSWELPTKLHVFSEEKGEEPFSISSRYTASLSPKATLYKILKSWRGRDFTPEELKGFEIKKVLERACMLQVVHKKDEDEEYANIEAVTSLPDGVECPALINKPVYFSMEPNEFEALSMEKVFANLSDGLKNAIRKSKEWQKLTGESAPSEDVEKSSTSDEAASAATGKGREIPW